MPCGQLSRGQRQRVAIGQALIHSPLLLILDEPASGLDPEARHDLAEVFTQLHADGMTLIVSSHILAELDEYSTHMLVIRQGRIREHRALQEPRGHGCARRVHVQVGGDCADLPARLRKALGAFPDVRVVPRSHDIALLEWVGDADHRAALLRLLLNAGLPVVGFGAEQADLQQQYLESLQSGAQ